MKHPRHAQQHLALLSLVVEVCIKFNACCREEEATEIHGHITSLAVARTHRKLGLATKLMQAARKHHPRPTQPTLTA